jgi:DTW domain-containing protein YfiP
MGFSRTTNFVPRALCHTCGKPASMCVCDDVQEVANRTHVIVVQHPRERNHPIGTARFARLGLRASEVKVWGPHYAGASSEALQASIPPDTWLLFPSEQAQDARALRVAEGGPPKHLLVLDGTWSQAKGLYLANPWMANLPHVRIAPSSPSAYRIRKEPADHCLSTIESIVATLRELEPATQGLERLLEAFHRMIDRQIAMIEQHGHARRRIRRPMPKDPIPEALRHEDVVVVYGELVGRGERRARSHDLVHWVAERLSTGETFERVVRSEIPIGEFKRCHLGLEAEDLETGVSMEELQAAWESFLRPRDVVAAWNQRTFTVMPTNVKARTLTAPTQVLLKAIYYNMGNPRIAGVQDAPKALGVEPSPPRHRGRAGMRLAATLAVARAMRAQPPYDASTTTPEEQRI